MRRLETMTEEELRTYFNLLAQAVEDILPPGPSAAGKCLFVLLVTHTSEPGLAQYVSNASRPECIQFLRETADRLESREDTPR